MGYTVSELESKLSLQEYYGWIQYFEHMNSDAAEPEKPNLLESENAMLSGFGL